MHGGEWRAMREFGRSAASDTVGTLLAAAVVYALGVAFGTFHKVTWAFDAADVALAVAAIAGLGAISKRVRR